MSKLSRVHAVEMGRECIVFNAGFTKVLFRAVGENGPKTTENWRAILSGYDPSLSGLSSEEISALLALFIYSALHRKAASTDTNRLT